ncbi:uncharacterized protein LOC119071750 [Bradysia coprophila]|uniref:uncharacterized protein LOC119071750 n=1 Tax=Bradysia coprophila TaxID=38358 RepID=UPI00187DAED6|nr:uncharacterized protein LOC119071750 [Bradysia coprophila]
MRSPVGRILLKVFELLGCIACVVTKALTDLESGRVFLRNQKLSREWGLLHNVFWSSSGNAFANVTYGGFTLIIALMLISRFIDAKSRPSLVEKIFLTVGMLCFFAMGGLVFASFDQVPQDLHDNVIVLGCLSFLVSLLILIDLADPIARHTSDTTQTENVTHNGHIAGSTAVSPLRLANGGVENKPINRTTAPQQTDTETTIQVHDVHEDSRSENHSPPQTNMNNIAVNGTYHRSAAVDGPPQAHVNNIALNGTYHRSDEVDFVQTKILPRAEQPVFEKVLLPEKRRPQKQNIPDPRENTSHMEFVTERIVDPRHTYDQRQTDYDQRQTAYDQRPTAYDQRPTAYDKKQTAYDHTSYHQNNFSHRDQHNMDNRYQHHQNYGYVRENMHTPKSVQSSLGHQHDRYGNRPLMVVRDYSNARANMSYDQRIKSSSYRRNKNYNHSVSSKSHCRSHCSSDDDENVSAIQPGFVATAAKIWDTRAKRDFNTVV